MATGSIRKRQGKRVVTWHAAIDIGLDPLTGKRQRTKRSFPTKREAQDWLSSTRHELRTGAYVEPSEESLATYLARWLDAANLYPATAYSYASVIRRRINPTLGHIPLARLDALAIQAFYGTLRDAGYKPKTVHLTHLVLHRALDQAVKWRLIRANPCDGVDAPRVEETEKPAWTAEEATAFLAATADDPLGPFWLLAVDSGMRLGELIALRWRDVDLTTASVVVRRTLTRTREGAWIIGDKPKSAAGRRPITLMAMTVADLERHGRTQRARKAALGGEWCEEGLVFDRGNGQPCSPATVQQAFQRAIAVAGVPRITPHQLRHTCGTLLGDADVHPKIAEERLGHKGLTMTMRYTHTRAAAQQAAATALAGLLGGARPQFGTKSGDDAENVA